MSRAKTLWVRFSVVGALSILGWIGCFGAPWPWANASVDGDALSPAARAKAIMGARSLRSAYHEWVARHEGEGGDRNVYLQLARTGTAEHAPDPRVEPLGVARIDLIEGRVDIRVRGLERDAAYEVWLLDNRPGPGNSMLPDASDHYLPLGALLQSSDGWSLERTLGADALAELSLDAVLVVRAGRHPTDGVLLAGAPDLFQRIYSATRSPRRLLSSGFATLSERVTPRAPQADPVFGVRTARAARKNPGQGIVVDPDVLIDELVALGADLFINEDFEGNGRTCETCHDFLNNNTIDPPFIARLPDNDPLFIAEQLPDLASTGTNLGALDIPEVLRAAALVGISEDGVDKPSVNRAVPHLKGLLFTSGPPVAVFRPFSPDNPAPFPLPAAGSAPDVPMGFALDNATVPPFDRGGFGGDLSFEPTLGLFGRIRDAVPGAVFLLFTKTLQRRIGVDLRLPTDLETDAITAFYFTLGRSSELALPIPLSDPIAARGQLAFMNDGGATNGRDPGQAQPIPLLDRFGNPIGAGKCNICHFNAGALANPIAFKDVERVFAERLGLSTDQGSLIGLRNMNFETGAERLTSQPADIVAGSKKARDAGFGRISQAAASSDSPSGSSDSAADPPACRGGRGGFGGVVALDFPGTNPPIRAGDCSEAFSTQPLIEAADTPPFFHNNAVGTIETAVSFYNSDAFNGSQGARILGAITGTNGIRLEATDVQSIAGFLRAINALDNIAAASAHVQATDGQSGAVFLQLLDDALAETVDAIDILDGAFINPSASARLRVARDTLQGVRSSANRASEAADEIRRAATALADAREIISPSQSAN